ncbi:hypothetical protein PoB_002052400 [Plakobranchus ocellatus]|uniref:Uncharacterized protein n=1 Tax=Plakobranchus ocellatus TaxID=259542 RepID=A0AAV3ZFA1_9GAST|nr:hypothetical protein PoB_002052400 [Plakobranchus ocellatus]
MLPSCPSLCRSRIKNLQIWNFELAMAVCHATLFNPSVETKQRRHSAAIDIPRMQISLISSARPLRILTYEWSLFFVAVLLWLLAFTSPGAAGPSDDSDMPGKSKCGAKI